MTIDDRHRRRLDEIDYVAGASGTDPTWQVAVLPHPSAQAAGECVLIDCQTRGDAEKVIRACEAEGDEVQVVTINLTAGAFFENLADEAIRG